MFGLAFFFKNLGHSTYQCCPILFYFQKTCCLKFYNKLKLEFVKVSKNLCQIRLNYLLKKFNLFIINFQKKNQTFWLKEFLPQKNHVIYPGKSDYQSPAPQIISRSGRFFEKQKMQIPRPKQFFPQKKKSPNAQTRLIDPKKIKYPPNTSLVLVRVPSREEPIPGSGSGLGHKKNLNLLRFIKHHQHSDILNLVPKSTKHVLFFSGICFVCSESDNYPSIGRCRKTGDWTL